MSTTNPAKHLPDDPPADPAAPAATGGDDGRALRRVQFGWYINDWANAAFSATVLTVFLGPYLTTVAKNAADASGDVHPLGLSIRAGSYFPYTVSFSVLISVAVMLLTGTVADRTGRHKELMCGFAYVGAVATMGMFFLDGDRYLLGGALLVVANIAYAVSVALSYAYLPGLAAPDERDAVSSKGWAYGYAGGGLLLIANLALFQGHDALGLSSGTAVRICLASAGLWWALFTIVPLLRLPSRAGVAPGTAGTSRTSGASGTSSTSGVSGTSGASEEPAAGSLRELGRTLKGMRRHPLTLLYLAAFLCYNDGIQTVVSQASLYGSEELGMDQTSLVAAVLMVQVVAIGGALLLGRIARRYGAKRTILGSLVGWVVTLALGYFMPAHQPLWFYALACMIGLVLGGSQALSRSLFSHLIPAGKEAEYFSVYKVSDRGTSWMGPLVFGLAYQITGSYRSAIISLLVFFVIGFAVLVKVPVRRAIEAVGNPVPERL
ncbi:UMF1 family MFS transporter [Streptomyces sp. 1114.5]|uniref:MFS transporter n=1 Tax=Streptomyces sp. 1114.5 TaxID=1938830 RepID=UPI000EB5771C|nr:MFS transporter [Streptomyces sp. 1114.5]RKT19328.1 UMF1 family MFS transporter [Streptomyces sp. 1114.5]